MIDILNMPEYDAKFFMRWVAKATEEYFKRPGVQERYQKWLKEEEEKKKNTQNKHEEVMKDALC